jgi:hypothetical protein
MPELNELVERYVALWNEPDPGTRRDAIRELWTEDGAQLLAPPREITERAIAIGFDQTTLEARGHRALEARVARAHAEFVAPGDYRFRRAGDPARVGDAVKFAWEMVGVADDAPAATGLEFLVLDVRGRIRLDYQFIES